MTAMEEILARFGKQATAFSPPAAPSKPTEAAKKLAPNPPMAAKSAADFKDAVARRRGVTGMPQAGQAEKPIKAETGMKGESVTPKGKTAADAGFIAMPQTGYVDLSRGPRKREDVAAAILNRGVPIPRDPGGRPSPVSQPLATPKPVIPNMPKRAMHGMGGASTDRQFPFLAASMKQQQAKPAVKKAEVEGKKIPKKVKEIADAVREENPKMPDATAYRIAWDTFKKETGGPTTGPKTGYGKAAELMASKVAAWETKLKAQMQEQGVKDAPKEQKPALMQRAMQEAGAQHTSKTEAGKTAQAKDEKRTVEPAVLRGALYGAAKGLAGERSYESRKLVEDLMVQWGDQKLPYDEAAVIVGKAVLGDTHRYPRPLRMEEDREDLEQLSKMSAAVKLARELSSKAREALPKSEFAMPGERKYPLQDLPHARNALARVSAHGTPSEQATVRREVYSRYPDLKEGAKERGTYKGASVNKSGRLLDEIVAIARRT